MKKKPTQNAPKKHGQRKDHTATWGVTRMESGSKKGMKAVTIKSAPRSKAVVDDENPEWTDEMFAAAVPAIEFYTKRMGKEKAEEFVYKKRGRPKSENPKELISIRVDADIVKKLRSTGDGWQSRVNEELRRITELW